MVLDLPGIENPLFEHSKRFDQGGGNIRVGMSTSVVALDGSGDFSDIQEAINALPKTGGIIKVKEGTYNINTRINFFSGAESTIIEGTGVSTNIVQTADAHGFEITTGKIVIIRDLKLTGPNSGSGIGIRLYNNSIVKVENCEIKEFGYDAINIAGAPYTVVKDCYLHSNGHSGIDIFGDKAIIMGNRCESNGDYGIDINPTADRCIILGNICLLNTTGQIIDGGSNTESGHNIVA